MSACKVLGAAIEDIMQAAEAAGSGLALQPLPSAFSCNASYSHLNSGRSIEKREKVHLLDFIDPTKHKHLAEGTAST